LIERNDQNCEACRDIFGQCLGSNWAVVAEEKIALGLLIAWLTMLIVAMRTLALVPIRLLGPRPRLRRLARQPGMIATFAAGTAIALFGMFFLVAALEAEIGLSTVLDSLVDLSPLFCADARRLDGLGVPDNPAPRPAVAC
jgi:hypothetical protein